MQLLNRSDRPTAIFCFNDRMAMGVYQAAAEPGILIPQELAVVGYDNQETITRWLRPALTTVQLPHYEMGYWAAEHLMQLIAAPQSSQTFAEQQSIGRRHFRRWGSNNADGAGLPFAGRKPGCGTLQSRRQCSAALA